MYVKWQKGDRYLEVFCDVSRESHLSDLFLTWIRMVNIGSLQHGDTIPEPQVKRGTVPMVRTEDSEGTHVHATLDLGKWPSGSYIADLIVHTSDKTPLPGEIVRLGISKDHRDIEDITPAEVLEIG